MNWILLPIAYLYQAAITLRHKLYDGGVLKSRRFETPLIGVGNLALGGTGKTPHVEYLIRLLSDHYQVATLSRGYGRKTRGFLLADETSTFEDLGDEPMQYHTKFPGVHVAVDEDRVEGVTRLLQEPNPPQAILLDDAFQHRKIQAGLNLLLTDYQHLYSDDRLVPVGSLRDIRAAARRAEIIVVSKSPKDLTEKDRQTVVEKLRPEEGQSVFFSYLEYEDLLPLNAAAAKSTLDNVESALLFCGIARPEPLSEALSNRFENIDTQYFKDHHPYRAKDVEQLLQRYESMEGKEKIIVTTEKDYARLANSPYICRFESAPLFSQPIRVCFHEEEKLNEIILSYVRKNHKDR